ncbi:twin-arginine translocation signal domain-containing protein [Halomarina rubra]|uniref:Twin-arginine translocation signal domain-containing protein n=1 Tax=Halomarina rubra TaxID=2071873 RepID=A0ABD6AY17_9EURY|nr:twin-arginine translocation signal domain-containing protein [Halomarina rubra]
MPGNEGHSRRSFLKLAGVSVAAAGVGAGSTYEAFAAPGETQNGWTQYESPTSKTLLGVVQTTEGPYAVGGSGDVLARRPDGWELVLDRGPTVQSNGLRAVGVTDDGRNVWFSGGSGVVGQYDVVDERLTDYSAPGGKTSTWEGIAVTGSAGSETVHLTNGSGEYLKGTKNAQGGVDWDTAIKPGGGSTATAVSFIDGTTGYICDTNGKVYETTDGGDSWSTIGIGSGGAGVALYDIAPVSPSLVFVSGGNGYIYRYDGTRWTPEKPGTNAIYSVDHDGATGLASGSGGVVYEYGADGWSEVQTPTTKAFRGCALDTSGAFPDVAVGSSGSVVERGDYTKPLPNTLAISTTSTEETGYRLVVDGAVEQGADVESADALTSNLGTPDVVTGTVGGTDATDTYSYSGEVLDFEITSGAPANVDLTLNGSPTEIKELRDRPWREVASPTGKTLYAAVQSSEGPFAVGAGGDVLARRPDGWEKVVEFGPLAKSNTLTCAGVSDDGRDVWFAGGSGVIGQYDAVDDTLTNYSAPKGKTSTWEGIAVTGTTDDDAVHLVNGSGEYLRGTRQPSGAMEWSDVVKPGGGSSAKGISFLNRSTGYIVDTNSKVYETTDGGDSWTTIGIPGGSAGLYDVDAQAEDRIVVTAGDGTLYRYNGAVWTKLYAGGKSLFAVDLQGDTGYAVGSSGALYELRENGWEADDSPVESGLRGVALSDTETIPDVAVGASGKIVERRSYVAPLTGFDAMPTDPDGDGRYEDLTGDGTFGQADAQALYDLLDDPLVQANTPAYDFNGDGTVDVSDVQKLNSWL